MNPLTSRLPRAIRIGECDYPINADFRTGIKIMIAFEDEYLTTAEKQQICLRLLYQQLPSDTTAAYAMAVKFLNCGDETTAEGGDSAPRLYSFTQDGKYIYAAILQSHGIDLDQEDDLHWWKFCYLFMGLQEECFFNRMVYLRKQKYFGKLTKEENELYYSLQDIMELPLEKDLQEADDDFMRQMYDGEKARSFSQ